MCVYIQKFVVSMRVNNDCMNVHVHYHFLDLLKYYLYSEVWYN